MENFWRELRAGEAGAVGSVYREVAAARNQLKGLDEAIADCGRRVAYEREEARSCERRRRLAEGIGDTETARVAAAYAARHRERAEVLERKHSALEAERRLCRRDLDTMERALQEEQHAAGGGSGGPVPELDDLNRHPAEGEFRSMEESERRRAAEERLAELKRKMDRRQSGR